MQKPVVVLRRTVIVSPLASVTPVTGRFIMANVASEGASGGLGTVLPLVSGIPFAGILLSIALFPLLALRFWHHHYAYGGRAFYELAHVYVADYVPFLILLWALYTVAGGIYVRGNLHGSPALNAGLMAIGAVLASLMGTTGASMLLIRPLIRANDNRKHAAHVVVFFIFIVSNAGGSLTPLGDPPLFLGFLKGVDFFWTVRHIFPETLFLVGSLLAYGLARTLRPAPGVTAAVPRCCSRAPRRLSPHRTLHKRPRPRPAPTRRSWRRSGPPSAATRRPRTSCAWH